MIDSKHTPTALILVLWLAGVSAAGQFAKITVILPDLGQAFGVQGAALGLLLSLISAIGLVCGLFAGALVGRMGPKGLLIGGLCFGAAISLLQSALPDYPLFLASRLLEGISHLLIVVAAPTVIGQITPLRHRASAMTLWSSFFAVSYAVFVWGGVPLVAAFGIPVFFWLHALTMIVLAGCLWRMLPHDVISRGSERLTLSNVWARHISAYSSPRIIAPAAGWLFYAAGFVALVTVMPAYFIDALRQSLAGFLPLVTMIVSMTIGLVLVRRYSPVPVVISGFLLAVCFSMSLSIGAPIEIAGICILGAAGLVQSGSFSSIPVLNADPQEQALANGAMAQMGNVGNMIGTPILLALTQMFGLAGLIGFAATAFAGGASMHLWLAYLRRKAL
ncbi:putative MFS family arabinose efflux permease [Pacificibacter maritimus]|uniref:Putative MFS family arabinose efflux permease n=1 Tax=Pacificibacter maritimus TaxID=762213 RepID=A0A3N4U539_9RHOB|nr:MFS transporter [Pacificibacter maritimus]RPE64888.1 putative MFS family arabinose efflux permease [Pacificibacter maritimus]